MPALLTTGQSVRPQRAIAAHGAVVAAVSSQRDVQRHFYRTILADGRAFLLCRTSLRGFDSAGRLTTARPPRPSRRL